jgi:hypothetical protein
MEMAKRDAVWDRRISERIRVRNDVRRLQQFPTLETTDGAVMLISADDSFAERRLVQPLAEQASGVSSPNRGLLFDVGHVAKAGKHALVDADGERQAGGVVSHDVDRPLGCVQAGNDSVEVDERNLLLHRHPEPQVLVVCRICPVVSIPKQAVVAESVVIWSGFTLDYWHSRDAERDRAWDLGFEDPKK